MKLFNILSNKYNKNEWKVYKIGKHENKLQQEQNLPIYDINTHYNLCETVVILDGYGTANFFSGICNNFLNVSSKCNKFM